MKINQKKFQAYEKRVGKEIICMKGRTYNVALASFLIGQDDRDAEEVNVDVAASACGFHHEPIEERDGCGIFLCPDGSKTVIDFAHVQKELDLEKPLIFDGDLLIDGHHRLYRAYMFGRAAMNRHFLTAAEKKLCSYGRE